MKEKLTMLIVDDLEVNRSIFRRTFQAVYDVAEAKDGVEALKILHERKIDIVILDLFMPNLNGIDVLKQMKLENKLSDIPVIVKTAVDENMESEMLKLGADDFIFSPFDTAIIEKRVTNIVQKYILKHMIMQQKIVDEKWLNKIRESMVSQMSEKIKESIYSIMEITKEGKAEERNSLLVKQQFDAIQQTGEKMLEIVDDILDISGENRQKLQLKNEKFHLNTVVGSITEIISAKCKEKGIAFEVDISSLVRKEIIGDSVLLRQLWQVILENSVAYTKPGKKVRTSLCQRLICPQEVELIIRIEDEGGQRKFPQIRSMAALMGGTIDINFLEKDESSIVLRIPYRCEKEAKNEKKCFNSMKTMFFDEDELICNYHVANLTRLGIQCEIAENNLSALRKMKEAYEEGNGYDCCFINWDMEKGKTIVNKIREFFKADMIRIVAATGEKSSEEMAMRQAGVDYILEKPLQQSGVCQLMTEICQSLNENMYKMESVGAN